MRSRPTFRLTLTEARRSFEVPRSRWTSIRWTSMLIATIGVEDQNTVAVLRGGVVTDLRWNREHVSRGILAAGHVGPDRRPRHRAPPVRLRGQEEGRRQRLT